MGYLPYQLVQDFSHQQYFLVGIKLFFVKGAQMFRHTQLDIHD